MSFSAPGPVMPPGPQAAATVPRRRQPPLGPQGAPPGAAQGGLARLAMLLAAARAARR